MKVLEALAGAAVAYGVLTLLVNSPRFSVTPSEVTVSPQSTWTGTPGLITISFTGFDANEKLILSLDGAQPTATTTNRESPTTDIPTDANGSLVQTIDTTTDEGKLAYGIAIILLFAWAYGTVPATPASTYRFYLRATGARSGKTATTTVTVNVA